jgi:hypothetical protein
MCVVSFLLFYIALLSFNPSFCEEGFLLRILVRFLITQTDSSNNADEQCWELFTGGNHMEHTNCSDKCRIFSVILAFTLTISAMTVTIRTFSEVALKQCCPCSHSASLIHTVGSDTKIRYSPRRVVRVMTS